MNKIRQILAFVRSLLDFLLNLGSHTPQKQQAAAMSRFPADYAKAIAYSPYTAS